MKIHDNSQQTKTIPNSLGIFMAMHDNSWWFRTIHENSWQFMTIHDKSWQFVHIHDNSWLFMPVQEDSLKFMITDGSWHFLPIHANFVVVVNVVVVVIVVVAVWSFIIVTTVVQNKGWRILNCKKTNKITRMCRDPIKSNNIAQLLAFVFGNDVTKLQYEYMNYQLSL